MFQPISTDVLSKFDDYNTVTLILSYRYITRPNHVNIASVSFRNITALMDWFGIVNEYDRYLLHEKKYFHRTTRTTWVMYN